MTRDKCKWWSTRGGSWGHVKILLGGKEDLAEGWMLSGTWEIGASSCMRSRSGSLGAGMGERPK
ncbi:hypothetical protein RhiirA1_447922 [Rhizophagus irregularis]|uniref:Uncharacterized protein n=1 Tax=Rhizophagus irregularis TaxID=588596 RepID=A0A2N0SKR5_9GLOM|nr:hypothetical protein RhiirA1_447922 [Rhizophagus irregularis]